MMGLAKGLAKLAYIKNTSIHRDFSGLRTFGICTRTEAFLYELPASMEYYRMIDEITRSWGKKEEASL